MVADASSARVPPTVLYHYTNAQGLVGILKSGTLWANHAKYTNDIHEFERGFEIANEILNSYSNESQPYYRAIEQSTSKFRQWYDMNAVYICCMTELDDDLAMWRGYATGHGYSIGLEVRSLRRAMSDLKTDSRPGSSVDFEPVSYDESEYRLRVEEAIRDYCETWDGVASEDLCERLFRLSVCYKDVAWSQEKEWRLIATEADWETIVSPVEFRPSHLGVTPYIELPVACGVAQRPNWEEIISKITVGPGNFIWERVRVVDAMVARLGGAVGVGTASKVPLRP